MLSSAFMDLFEHCSCIMVLEQFKELFGSHALVKHYTCFRKISHFNKKQNYRQET